MSVSAFDGLVVLASMLQIFQHFAAREWARPANRPLAVDLLGTGGQLVLSVLGIAAVVSGLVIVVLAFLQLRWFVAIGEILLGGIVGRIVLRFGVHSRAALSSIVGVLIIDIALMGIAIALWLFR